MNPTINDCLMVIGKQQLTIEYLMQENMQLREQVKNLTKPAEEEKKAS